MTKLQQKREFVFVNCMTKLLSHLWEEKEEHAKSAQDRSDEVSKLLFSIDRCVLTSMLNCVCSLPSPGLPSLPFFTSPSSFFFLSPPPSPFLLLFILLSPSPPISPCSSYLLFLFPPPPPPLRLLLLLSSTSLSISRDFSLRGLYQLLRDSVTSLRQDRPVCLIIDDISVLLGVGVGVAEVVSLVHYCQQLLCSPDGLCKVHMVRLEGFTLKVGKLGQMFTLHTHTHTHTG